MTGINGQIGSYLYEILYQKDYLIYGLVRSKYSPKGLRDVIYVYCDIANTQRLKKIIESICPDEIYHLAGQTNAVTSIAEPEETLWVNGNVVMSICEVIRRCKPLKEVKLFQANSAELFKGMDIGKVDESTLSFYPKNPYGIGKLASYWIVRYYRDHYGLYVCNGLIFNAESPRRKACYVTTKIVQEVHKIVNGQTDTLQVGTIDSCRDWIHAQDVAQAAWMSLQQKQPEDYIISLGHSHSVRTFIERAFSTAGMPIQWIRERGSVEEKGVDRNGKIVVEIDPTLFRPYEQTTKPLVGDNRKLLQIGWCPTYDIDGIICDMFENLAI